jgi:hypothetical protein
MKHPLSTPLLPPSPSNARPEGVEHRHLLSAARFLLTLTRWQPLQYPTLLDVYAAMILDGMSEREVARLYRVSKGTISVRLKALRELIGEDLLDAAERGVEELPGMDLADAPFSRYHQWQEEEETE